ncbi:hypothetical protein [Methylotetracoccus oryzae]|uniref:hypothetical protein n=1 Tax=Methylotetracoccus oryzae TaxID=1919059 RepID=UPI00111AE56B|nr:hypothetical protein [Methylotetracoccus oryzae]
MQIRSNGNESDNEIYRLDSSTVIHTAENLRKDIVAKFPGSTLARLSQELETLARQADEKITSFTRPVYKIRVLSFLAILAAIFFPIWALSHVNTSWKFETVTDLFEALDAGFNLTVLLAGALWFLYSFEADSKRQKALKSIRELRQFIHTIDITQMYYTPDLYKPDSHLSRSTAKLDYSYPLLCANMLGIIGNLSALYTQADTSDSLWRAASEVEALVNSLSTKLASKAEVIRSMTFPDESRREN